MTSSSNKQIAKNTLFLYIRMLLVMFVSLYTARVVLRVLGVEDYGVYNVVAGIVSTFSFLTGTISAATSRFFAFEIGRNNTEKLIQYFRLSMCSFFVLGLFVVLLAETVGLWFFYNKMVIPAERMGAAFWVFQFTVLSFVVQMLSIPYNAAIVARERMNVYAYIGILEVVLKLAIVFVLVMGSVDKLKLYAILTFSVTVIVAFVYALYCRTKYTECRLSFFWNKAMFKEFFAYSFWNLFGSFAGVCRGQGLNITLNLFYGPVVNAAYGISYQVNSAVNQFVHSFYTACRPQITKRYAAGQTTSMLQLVFSSSRMCYFLVLVFAVPILIETPFILQLWLKSVPDYTVTFIRFVIAISLIDACSFPFQAAVAATGKIKWYQIITGGLMVLTLFIAYVLLKMGFAAEVVFYTSIVTTLLAQVSRIVFMHVLVNMDVVAYFKEVVAPMAIVTVLSFVLPLCAYIYMEPTWVRSLLTIALAVVSTLAVVFVVGIKKEERNMIMKYINQR